MFSENLGKFCSSSSHRNSMHFLFQKNRKVKTSRNIVLYIYLTVINIKDKGKMCPHDLYALIFIDFH